MADYFEFEVSLEEIEPRIWRRFLLSQEASFAELHEAIQDSFGWTDTHLWEFYDTESAEVIAGVPDEEDLEDEEVPDANEVSLSDHFGGADRCMYVYDMGDDWEHEVVLVGTASEPGGPRRKLLGGARACPPEDCGGVAGYEELMEFIATGQTPEDGDAEALRDLVATWEPEAFDLEEARAAFDR